MVNGNAGNSIYSQQCDDTMRYSSLTTAHKISRKENVIVTEEVDRENNVIETSYIGSIHNMSYCIILTRNLH